MIRIHAVGPFISGSTEKDETSEIEGTIETALRTMGDPWLWSEHNFFNVCQDHRYSEPDRIYNFEQGLTEPVEFLAADAGDGQYILVIELLDRPLIAEILGACEGWPTVPTICFVDSYSFEPQIAYLATRLEEELTIALSGKPSPARIHDIRGDMTNWDLDQAELQQKYGLAYKLNTLLYLLETCRKRWQTLGGKEESTAK